MDTSVWDDAAERATLGCCMLDIEGFTAVIATLGERPPRFYKTAHQLIYDAMLALRAENAPVDFATTVKKLNTTGRLGQVGGLQYVHSIFSESVTSANAAWYAQQVLEKSRRRAVAEAANKMLARVFDDALETDALLEQSQALLSDAMNDRKDALPHDMASLSELYFGGLQGGVFDPPIASGWPTGFGALDNWIAGLHRGHLVVVGARPSMGKTAVAQHLLLNTARQGVAGCFFSLEMVKPELMMRFLGMLSSVSIWRILKARMDGVPNAVGVSDLEYMKRAQKEMKLLDITLYDREFTLSGIRSAMRAWRDRTPSGGLVVVDYLQLMSGSGKKDSHREQEVAECSRALKQLAKELDICVLALSQLNRAAENRPENRPTLSDLRESGAIEQDADAVLMLYRESYYKPDAPKNELEVLVRKNRHGETGVAKLRWNAPCLGLDDFPELPHQRGKPSLKAYEEAPF